MSSGAAPLLGLDKVEEWSKIKSTANWDRSGDKPDKPDKGVPPYVVVGHAGPANVSAL
jgi:hypothetical protein